MFLRELPEPLIPFPLYEKLLNVGKLTISKKKKNLFSKINNWYRKSKS